MRVVLDTHVLLSGLAYPASLPGRILAAWRAGALEVVLSDYILEELRRVLPRLQSRHGLSEAEMNEPKSGSYSAATSWFCGNQGGRGLVIFATT